MFMVVHVSGDLAGDIDYYDSKQEVENFLNSVGINPDDYRVIEGDEWDITPNAVKITHPKEK